MAAKPKPKPRLLKVEHLPDPSRPDEYEEGMPWGGIVQETYSRPPGAGSYDTVKRGKKRQYTFLRARIWAEDSKGVRRRLEVTGKTEAELNRKVKELKTAPSRSDVKRLTIGDFLTEQFLPAVKLRAKANTYRGYESAIRLHIVPHIGKAKLAALKPTHVDAWLSDLDAKPRAKQNAFVTLKVALNYAVRDLGLLDRNPIDRMKAPRAPKREQHILTLTEVKKLLKAAQRSQWYTLLYLAIATSMREGELFALAWRDVDLKRGTLYVRQGIGNVYDDETESGYRRAVTSPKTDASRRRADLSAEAIALLKAHRKSLDGKPNPHGLVFPNEAGGFIHVSNFQRRVWAPLLKSAKLPYCKFHSLRHSGNSILAQQGLSLPLLQRRLGHATSKTTMDTYSHVGAEEGRRGAKIIGSLLGGEKTGETRPKTAAKHRVGIKKKA
jgi:integrase